jgi:hypothetical protein
MTTVLLALLKLIGCVLIGSLITFLILVVIGLANKITRLEKFALELYSAGFWKAEGLSAHQSAALWERFRDLFNIPVGTATAKGVGDTYQACPRKVRCE